MTKILNRKQIDLFLFAIGRRSMRDALVARIILNTGLAMRYIVALKYADVFWGNLPKMYYIRENRHNVYLNTSVRKYLLGYKNYLELSRGDWLLWEKEEQKTANIFLCRSFNYARKDCKLKRKVTPSVLRITAGARIYKDCEDYGRVLYALDIPCDLEKYGAQVVRDEMEAILERIAV